jgi:serine/threonine-protein phosphatase 5
MQGVGIAFGPDVTKRWCVLNGVTGIIRSHEVRQGKLKGPSHGACTHWHNLDGYAIEHDGLCTTVSSHRYDSKL